MNFDSLIADKLPFEKRMKIKGGWPDRVSIVEIGMAVYPDDKQKRALLIRKIIESCKAGSLNYYGYLDGWQWGRCLYDDFGAYIGRTENPRPDVVGTRISSGDIMKDAVSSRDNMKALPSDCLIHKDDFRRYLEAVKKWPASGLLANWWVDDGSTAADTNSDTVSGKTAIPNKDVNKEPGRQEERRGYFCAIWERLGKPKQNTKIWFEIKKLSKQKDNDSEPIREVIGRKEFYFRYEDGNIENIARKTFQNDMSTIRKEK
ncbi:MAG: hypothetical protein ACXV9R_12450 [Methylobacter sp.]